MNHRCLSSVASASATAVQPLIDYNFLTFLFGIGAGAGLGFVFPQMGWYGGMLVGAMAAASVVLIHELYRREPRPRSAWAGIASGIVPVLFAGVLVYLAGRLLVG